MPKPQKENLVSKYDSCIYKSYQFWSDKRHHCLLFSEFHEKTVSVTHSGHILCVWIPQIMKEWAEADNQSKNLPRSERQDLNEVSRHLSNPLYWLTVAVSQIKWIIMVFSLPAFPVCAADAGGASCWRETETCGDSSCPGWGHSQQQPPPGPGELFDSCTVWSPSGKTTLEYRGGEKAEINNCRYLVDLSIFIPGSKLEEPLSHFLVFYFSLLSAAELCLPARACAAGAEALHGCRAEGPQTHIETLPAYCGGWPPEGWADEIPGVCVRACEVFGWGEHTPVLCTRESLVCWPWNTQKTENSTMWGSYKSSFHSTKSKASLMWHQNIYNLAALFILIQ